MASNKRTSALIVWAIVLVAIIFGLYYYFARMSGAPGSGPVACTEEAKLCPDGSYVGRTGPDCAFAACPAVDTSNWKTYTSAAFGFSFKYPPNWQSSGDQLSVADPHIFFGNPLNGTTTYALKVFIYNNPQDLAPADFVPAMIASDTAADASNSAGGPAPQLTPHFSSEYATTVAGYPAYELYGVFEYDQSAEEIYVQQNKQMLVFDFPVADDNPNLANPALNNALVHVILGTLTIDPNVWKFCGGIAAFPCATGYSCQLDGTYPDAGGHCVSGK
jgi:hypothetical protein